jgi:hypothetical protein
MAASGDYFQRAAVAGSKPLLERHVKEAEALELRSAP